MIYSKTYVKGTVLLTTYPNLCPKKVGHHTWCPLFIQIFSFSSIRSTQPRFTKLRNNSTNTRLLDNRNLYPLSCLLFSASYCCPASKIHDISNNDTPLQSYFTIYCTSIICKTYVCAKYMSKNRPL